MLLMCDRLSDSRRAASFTAWRQPRGGRCRLVQIGRRYLRRADFLPLARL